MKTMNLGIIKVYGEKVENMNQNLALENELNEVWGEENSASAIERRRKELEHAIDQLRDALIDAYYIPHEETEKLRNLRLIVNGRLNLTEHDLLSKK